MTKIMIVEDDNNLREIYGARLQAEGYEIVAAKDGEEALASIVAEKPDLVLSDIMMPKISGFDMLDIIRSTPETKHTKVIMMTALSQKEDQERGEKLGADRYLVKSQITLEDVVRVAGEVLNGTPAGAPPTTVNPTNNVAPADDTPTTAPPPAPEPANEPTPAPAPAPEPKKGGPAPAPTPDLEPKKKAPKPPAPAKPAAKPTPAPAPAPEPKKGGPTPAKEKALDANGRKKKVIEPINDPTEKPDINKLIEKEMAKESGAGVSPTTTETTAQEIAEVDQQIADAKATLTNPTTPAKPADAPNPNDIAL